MAQLEFWVAGVAAPKGSTKSFPIPRANGTTGVATMNANPKTKDWQARVATEAQRAANDYAFEFITKENEVKVTAQFILPRPRSRKNKGFFVKPDLDKLARALLDGLTDVVFEDDSQVVALNVTKEYSKDCLPPGVLVTVAVR
jgi:Holliday junction resolvase RusA-like endonuclease